MSKPNYASLLAQIAAETDPTAKAALEAQCYQFPEPLTAAEENLFNYVSTDYLIGNPGQPFVGDPMEVFNDTLTIIGFSYVLNHQSTPANYPVPDGAIGYFLQAPNTFTPNYVDGSTDNFILWLTEDPFNEDAGAHIGAVITLSSGSNELKMTITSIGANNFGNLDLYGVNFRVQAHSAVGLSYFENLSDNDTLNIRIESPGKNSYIGTYYDDNGIIG